MDASPTRLHPRLSALAWLKSCSRFRTLPLTICRIWPQNRAQLCLHVSACDPAPSTVRKGIIRCSSVCDLGCCQRHCGPLCPKRAVAITGLRLCSTLTASAATIPRQIEQQSNTPTSTLAIRSVLLCIKINDRVQTTVCLPRAPPTPYVKQPAAQQKHVHTHAKACAQQPCTSSSPYVGVAPGRLQTMGAASRGSPTASPPHKGEGKPAISAHLKLAALGLRGSEYGQQYVLGRA